MRVTVDLANPIERGNSLTIESALIDTGSTRTMVNREVANQLGLEVMGQQLIRTADGVHEIDKSFALIRYDGKETIGDIWVSDSYPGVLIGVITLESLGLAVDPVNNRLIDVEFLLL